MRTTEARKTFEAALKDVSRVRFYEYVDWPFRDKRITLKPKAVALCDRRSCDAGDNCCHQVKRRGILFCIYEEARK